MNVKELKARLSAYLREVDRGEEFLVTDRSRVVARLGPPASAAAAATDQPAHDPRPRLLALGVRPPLRARGPADYRRAGAGSGLSTAAIDALLAEVRDERR